MAHNTFARPEAFLDRSPCCAEKINATTLRRLKTVYTALNEVVTLWTPIPVVSAGLCRKVSDQLRAWGHTDIRETEARVAIQIIKGIDTYLTAVGETKERLRRQATGLLAQILAGLETDGVREWGDLAATVQESTSRVRDKAYEVYGVSIWLIGLYDQLRRQDEEQARKEKEYAEAQYRLSVQSQAVEELEKKLARVTDVLSQSEKETATFREENERLRYEIETGQNTHLLTERILGLELLVGELQERLTDSVALQEKYRDACAYIESLRLECRALREENAQGRQREWLCRAGLATAYMHMHAGTGSEDTRAPAVREDSGQGDDLPLDLPTAMGDGKEIRYHERRFIKRLRKFDSAAQGYVLAAMWLFANDPFAPELASKRVEQTRVRIPTKDRIFHSYLPGLKQHRFMWRWEGESTVLVLSLYRKGRREDTRMGARRS